MRFWETQASTSLGPKEFAFVRDACSRYLPATGAGPVASLNIPSTDAAAPRPHFSHIALPDWAVDIGVGNPAGLLAPSDCILPGDGPPWLRCDWWRTLFYFLTGEAERAFEAEHGPVHSYALRLPDNLAPVFDRAWCNRIMLFLRRYGAYTASVAEDDAFGTKPGPILHLTHDVDAVAKTLPIRIKKAAFDGFNVMRAGMRGQFRQAMGHAGRGVAYFFRRADYWYIDQIAALEAGHGLTSVFNVYGGRGSWRRSPRRILLDPGYDVADQKIAIALRTLTQSGFGVGLHQSFDAWKNADGMQREKNRVEEAIHCPVTICRQHWLRFSWYDTWAAQERAGFALDMTLGFNDRPGFRNGAALRLPAWIAARNASSQSLSTVPLMLMDSHLFDYGLMEPDARRHAIDHWLDELAFTGGEASVVWHQRVFHPQDYGWGTDYEYLLGRAAAL